MISVERVGVERRAVHRALRLGGERRHALGATGDAEVVDAGVVEQRGDQRRRTASAASAARAGRAAYSRRGPVDVLGRPRPRRAVPGRRDRSSGRVGRDDVAGRAVAVRRGRSGSRSANSATYAHTTASTWSSTRRRSLLRGGRPPTGPPGPPGRARRPASAGRRPPAPRAGGSARAARRGARRACGRACSCTSGSGRAGTARPSPGAGRPRSPAARRPDAGSMSRLEPRAEPGAARPVANSGLPVLDGCAPASNRAKSRLSAASAGRLPVGLVTTSGASMATRHRPRRTAPGPRRSPRRCGRPQRGPAGRRRRGRRARWACAPPTRGRRRRSAWATLP